MENNNYKTQSSYILPSLYPITNNIITTNKKKKNTYQYNDKNIAPPNNLTHQKKGQLSQPSLTDNYRSRHHLTSPEQKEEQKTEKRIASFSNINIEWENNITRVTLNQSLPNIESDHNATLIFSFEVHPDGTVGIVYPLQKMNPRLEQEMMKHMRQWRFSALPEHLPQKIQQGRVRFFFRLNQSN